MEAFGLVLFGLAVYVSLIAVPTFFEKRLAEQH